LFFIGRDAENDEAEVAGAKSIEALQEEIKALRADIQAIARSFTQKYILPHDCTFIPNKAIVLS
jgi:hypothetical protein